LPVGILGKAEGELVRAEFFLGPEPDLAEDLFVLAQA